MVTNDCYEIARQVKANLQVKPPKLSGNLRYFLASLPQLVSKDEIVMIISAPLYDVDHWMQTGQIQFLPAPNPKYPDITDYAMWLNDVGAFGTKNKSLHWANRGIYNGCSAMAMLLSAKGHTVVIDNRLDLS